MSLLSAHHRTFTAETALLTLLGFVVLLFCVDSGEPRGVSPRMSSSVTNGRQSSEKSAGSRLAARLRVYPGWAKPALVLPHSSPRTPTAHRWLTPTASYHIPLRLNNRDSIINCDLRAAKTSDN